MISFQKPTHTCQIIGHGDLSKSKWVCFVRCEQCGWEEERESERSSDFDWKCDLNALSWSIGVCVCARVRDSHFTSSFIIETFFRFASHCLIFNWIYYCFCCCCWLIFVTKCPQLQSRFWFCAAIYGITLVMREIPERFDLKFIEITHNEMDSEFLLRADFFAIHKSALHFTFC